MRSERFESGGDAAVHELIEAPSRARRVDHRARGRPQMSAIQPRLVVALLLIAGGLVWSFARGLHFYGLTPESLIYDLDQPPLLLVFVAGWLLYRSRAR